MTFIDPYKQNDVYTIEIKKNAYFDYNKELEDSSKAFQNKSTYNVKVPKAKSKALVEDVEFRNIPKVDSNKKGLLDSLFTFFKGDETEDKPKPRRRNFKPNRGRPSQKGNPKNRKPRNSKDGGNKKFTNSRKPMNANTKAKPKPSPKPKAAPKPKKATGNVKQAEVVKPVVDDNIGNRIEKPVQKKKPVRRAKNDPRSGNQ